MLQPLLLALLLTGCVHRAVSSPVAQPAAAPPLLRAAANAGPVQVWITTAEQARVLSRDGDLAFSERAPLPLVIEVDDRLRYQAMTGFGAALTDASVMLIGERLGEVERAALLRELFGPPPGIGLSFVRIAIGASDFSTRHYTLDDRPAGESDPSLAHFALDQIPAQLFPLLRAIRAINPKLQVVASPWTAPAWMKDRSSLVGGHLRPAAYGAFADYLLRFVQESARSGVPIDALTVQNEPGYEPKDYPGMLFSARARARFIGGFLGPRLALLEHPPLLLDWDHNWDHPEAPLRVLADPTAARYLAGIAWHCYKGGARAQDLVHDAHPDKDAYLTECSGGGWLPQWGKALHQLVGPVLIGSTRAWARGVILWNLALDEHHGPHAGGCRNCRGVLTIDAASGQVTRNVEYYALAHLSRFVRPGARRIASGTDLDGLESVAFRNADDGSLVLLVLNGAAEARAFSVRSAGQNFAYRLSAGAVATFSWRTDPVSSAAD